MRDGAVFGGIDFFHGEERGAPLFEAALGGELREQAQRQRAGALARIVELHAGRFRNQLPRAPRVAGRELGQPGRAPGVGVRLELLPCRAIER